MHRRSTGTGEAIMDESNFNKLAGYATITAVAEDTDLLGHEVTSVDRSGRCKFRTFAYLPSRSNLAIRSSSSVRLSLRAYPIAPAANPAALSSCSS
jgi:hypothetical protein